MRTPLIVALPAVLVLAATGAYYALEVYPQQQFRAGLDLALARLPPGTTATYKSAHYSPLTHTAVVSGITVRGEFPGNAPQRFEFTADTVETGRPNLDFVSSWSRAEAVPAEFGPDTAVPLAGSVKMTGVTLHSTLLRATEESLQVTNVRIYPWAFLHDGMPTWHDVQTALTPSTGSPGMAGLQTILRFEAAALAGIAYDSYQAGPMQGMEMLPQVTVQYDVHKMTGDGLDRGVIKGGTGEGIVFGAGPAGTVALDRVAIGPVDVRAAATRLINGEKLTTALLDGIKIGRIDYSGITVRLTGQPAVHIGGVFLGPVELARGMPVAGRFGWTDVSVSRAQLNDPRARSMFEELGLSTMTTSFAFAYDWDVATQRASVHDTVLTVNELGTLRLSADVTDVPATPAGLSQARLAHARLQFDDASLVDRLVRAGAAQSGTDPAAYRQQLVTMVRQQSSAQGVESPALTAACDAAGGFLAAPHSLVIELAPTQPVPLMALKDMQMQPATLASTLGLVVSDKQ